MTEQVSSEGNATSGTSQNGSILTVPDEKDLNAEQKFNALAQKWKEETMFLSSATAITSNFWYYRIIGLGSLVIPFILRDLEKGGGHWFLALKALTGENPVKPEDLGNRKKMTHAWLEWGKQNGLI
jgi:hypothetical protein